MIITIIVILLILWILKKTVKFILNLIGLTIDGACNTLDKLEEKSNKSSDIAATKEEDYNKERLEVTKRASSNSRIRNNN